MEKLKEQKNGDPTRAPFSLFLFFYLL